MNTTVAAPVRGRSLVMKKLPSRMQRREHIDQLVNYRIIHVAGNINAEVKDFDQAVQASDKAGLFVGSRPHRWHTDGPGVAEFQRIL